MQTTTVFLDLETGGTADHHPDIQLAAIAVRDWEEIDLFERKIQFDALKADPEALAINSYDATIWEALAVKESAVVSEFGSFLDRHRVIKKMSNSGSPYFTARIAGHNARTFDAPRLYRMFQRNAAFFPADVYRPLDTLALALWHFAMHDIPAPPNYKLATLCTHLGILTDDSHDALADVRMTIAVAKRLTNAAQE